MVQVASLFNQLLHHFPRLEFAALVKKHQAERAAKGFNCWTQFVAMLFCQLGHADSLREICNGLSCCLGKLVHLGIAQAPNKSTLSYANEHRPAALYEELFYTVLARFRSQQQLGVRKRTFRFKNKLLSLDSTTVSLCLTLFPWAKFRRIKGGVKAHVLMDHDDYLPRYVLLTPARAKWLHDRQAELLPVEYFHVVFTVPEEIAAIAYQNKQVVYGILFRAAAETLHTIAADPKHLGAEIGFLAILHSWGQNLLFHPHLHCVVPGGGISPGGQRWIACRPGFFLPVRVLSCLFRRLFLEYLQTAFDTGKLQFFSSLERLREPRAFAQYLAPLKKVDWVVYAKPPFGGPEQVLNYLGRYTHRVAISNNRLLDIDNGKVTFSWKDYRDHAPQKALTLQADEFIRRFLLHVLPDGFQRIRHYGFLGHRYRQAKLALCRQLLGVVLALTGQASPQGKPDFRELYERLTGKSLRQCPICHAGHMVAIAVLPATDRAPPFTTA